MSYADAAASGLDRVTAKSETEIPIESVGISDEDVKKARKELDKTKTAVERISEQIRDGAIVVSNELQDPAVGSSVLVSVIASIGAGFALWDQKKTGKLTWPVGLAVTAGVFAVGFLDYFGVSKFYKKK